MTLYLPPVLIAVGDRFTKMIGCLVFWLQEEELSWFVFREFSVECIFTNIEEKNWGKWPLVKYLQMDTMRLWWMYFIYWNIMHPWDPSTWVMMRPLWFFCLKDAGRRPIKITVSHGLGTYTKWSLLHCSCFVCILTPLNFICFHFHDWSRIVFSL